jgi:hypothetical protein
MEYCYIVVIKKAGAWGCWGGANLPYVLNRLNPQLQAFSYL